MSNQNIATFQQISIQFCWNIYRNDLKLNKKINKKLMIRIIRIIIVILLGKNYKYPKWAPL